jgi:GTP-binding protein
MQIKKAVFAISNTNYKKCPATDFPEYAFIGRSNVGKSSLINKLVNHANLAKTSAKPGKTQLINHFLINDHWYLVDLPGFGYAKVSQTERFKFSQMIKEYLLNRKNLACIFVLIDSRLEPQAIDLDFMAFLGENGLPFVMAFTKADKQSKNQLQSMLARYRKTMLDTWAEMPHYFITSADTGEGCEDLRNYIGELNEQVNKNLKK